MTATFQLAFRTGWFHGLCRAILADDSRHDESTLGSRWWNEAIDSHRLDDDDRDSDRVGALTIRNAAELQEFFARMEAFNVKSRAREPVPGEVLTAHNLGLSIQVEIEDGPYRAFADTPVLHYERLSSARVRRRDAAPEFRAAMDKVHEGLMEIERLA